MYGTTMNSTSSPAGSRRQARGARSERRIEALLKVAREVFAERGFQGATTAEIATRLEVSEATIFSYFSSKRELCIEVVRRWYDEISHEVERQVPLLPGFDEQLLYVVRQHLVNLMDKGRGLCALVLSEGRVADTEFTEVIAQLKRRYTAPLMQAMQAARDAQCVRDDVSIRLMRDMVYGSMEHVLWDYVASGQKPPIEPTAQHLCQMLLAAFAVSPPPQRALVRFHTDVRSALDRLEASTPAGTQAGVRGRKVGHDRD